ncbi:hypothetical protein Sjap_006501 [Stephania japonica]|uniref:Uncharacterized protein n=1 Tax=Stephania japonica TaxID=461633 RepID=A0AAP0K7K4_9MAGN
MGRLVGSQEDQAGKWCKKQKMNFPDLVRVTLRLDNIKQFQNHVAAAIWNNEIPNGLLVFFSPKTNGGRSVEVEIIAIRKGVASSATTASGGNEPARKSEHDSHATQSQSYTNVNESGSSKCREHGKLQHKKKRSKRNE